jgi:hypothetical protein
VRTLARRQPTWRGWMLIGGAVAWLALAIGMPFATVFA